MGESGKSVVIVTGGAGYIGSNVVRQLARSRCIPVVVDSFRTGSEKMLDKRFRHFNCDIRNAYELSKCFDEVIAEIGSPRAVIHLAAMSNVGWCEQNAIEAFEINVIGTGQVAHVAALKKVPKFVFASSAAVYGDNGNKPCDTGAQVLRPLNIYGSTKFDAERLLATYFKDHMSITMLRLFNVAGAWCDQFPVMTKPLGKPDPNSPAIFPALVRNFLNGSQFSMNEITGLFFTSSPVRDFIHVREVAEQVVNAAVGGLEQPQVMNLGRGKPIKIHDLLQLTKLTKSELHDRVNWNRVNGEEIHFSVAGKYNLGDGARRTLLDMWLDEIRWQRSKLFKLIKTDSLKGKIICKP